MRTTKQMSVTLPLEMADMVRARVASGIRVRRGHPRGSAYPGCAGPSRRGLAARRGGRRPVRRRPVEGAVRRGRACVCARSPDGDLHHPVPPQTIEQLASLYRYVAEASSPQVAADYVDAIEAHCEDWLCSRTAAH